MMLSCTSHTKTSMKKLNTSSTEKKYRTLGSKPVFHLIYLVFYFFPWLLKAPETTDIVAIVVAIAIFLPVYFHSTQKPNTHSLPHIAGITLIGFAVSPFFGSHGVFHVYACAQAGFIRPERTAWVTTLIVASVFAAFSLLTQQAWWDSLFPLFLGFLVAAGTITTADQMEQHEALQLKNEYDQQMATLAERERIAQDLHDLLGQTLTMVSLKSEVALKLLDHDTTRTKQEITEIRDASRDALKDVRAAVSGMNHTTVHDEFKRAKKILSSANIKLTIKGQVPPLNASYSHVLGLTIREAITNIARHSQASEAELTFNSTNQQTMVTIEDNGTASGVVEGSGLRGIRDRIQSLGGETTIESSAGMRISLTIPNA